jgi:hypothetical protein
MDRSEIARTLPQSPMQETVFGSRSAVEIADLLLLAILRHKASAIFIAVSQASLPLKNLSKSAYPAPSPAARLRWV